MENEIQKVLEKYQELKYEKEKNILSGILNISSGDSYEVLIKLDSYPRFFPVVFEMGGRIPRKADRHIYTNSGSCCFTTRAQSQILLKTRIRSLLQFMDEIVVRYFENNSYFEINKRYFGEAYNHGIKGVVEGYQDILGVEDLQLIFKVIGQRIKNLKINRNDLCYCESGRKLKRCHGESYRNFRKIEREVVVSDFKNLIQLNS
ncbi:hypothetical protein F3C99_11155 [Vitellibacter sp. q18]|nr:hypothetical protein [Aequorivita lutea]